MTDTILAAIIGFVATITGVLLTAFFTNRKNRSRGIYLLRPDDNFDDLLGSVHEILMYTVNSFELSNRVNTLLEQKSNVSLQKLTILVRNKDNETKEDIANLNDVISIWKRWVTEGRIRELNIIGYDYDPDHYYTILGNELVFTGHVYFDDTKPTGTHIDYSPLIFRDDTKLGRDVIKNYRHHFNQLVNRYKDRCLYTSERATTVGKSHN